MTSRIWWGANCTASSMACSSRVTRAAMCLLRVSNLTRWLVAPAVRNAHPSSPNSCSSRSRDLLPLVTSPWRNRTIRRFVRNGSLLAASCSTEISQRLVSGIWHPYRCQLSRAIAPGRLQSIAPVRLHAISRPHRYQCWRYYFALGVQHHQLPVQHVARRAGLITESQFFNRDPVSLPIYERTHIDLVLLQSITLSV